MRFTNLLKLFIFTLTVITFAGCGASDSYGPVTADGVATEEASSRLTPIDKAVTLKEGDQKTIEDEEIALPFFTYVASAEAPLDVETKQKFQATNFAVQDSVAIVTYAMAGNLTRGAIDFVDIHDLKKPRIISTLVFKNSEFADVAVSKKYAYLVGANENGAYLHIRTIAPAEKSEEVSSLELPGFYATHIRLDRNYAWISSGNNMGLLKVDVSNAEKPVVVEKVEIQNALSSVKVGSQLFVLGGKGQTSVLRVKDSKIVESKLISESEVEAPGRMAATSRLLITNAGWSGLSVFRPNSKELELASNVDLKGTGNGIDLHLTFAFLAQGEAGLMVMNLMVPEKPLYLGRFDFDDDAGSANQIRIYHEVGHLPVAFVADGRGGFKIISIRI